MRLPKFSLRSFKINERDIYFIPLPKLSPSLLRKLEEVISEVGYTYVKGKFRRGKEYVIVLKKGALITNFEPSSIMRELDRIEWEDFRENLGLEPTWNNSYFTKLENGVRLNPRMNLSKRSFYRLLAKGCVPLMYDEIYIILGLALKSHRVRAISYRTYTAERAKFLRHVGKMALYKVEFSSNSLRNCIDEIWKDVIKGRPAFLPEPGTYTITVKLGEIDLKEVFSGLGEWCLSDRNLAFPPGQDPSSDLPLRIP